MATTRGYVAVNFSFDSRTDKVAMTARKDMTIKGENGAVVTLKQGEKFTAVRAASLGENMWYIVRDVTGEKKCSCAATKPCRHEKLVAAAKVAQSQDKLPVQPVVSKIVDISKRRDMLSAPLNGNRPFSILRVS